MHKIINAEEFAKKSKLYEVRANDHYVFWLEADPAQRNRQYLNCYDIATKQKILITSPEEYNVRSGINEYGGGSYWLNNHRLYFVNKDNSAVYYINLDDLSTGSIKPILVAASLLEETGLGINYADGIVLENNNFIAVRETIKGHTVTQQLVIYDSETYTLSILDDTQDFYAFPRFNENTNQLLWLNWQHPNMPWDQSALYLADLIRSDNQYILSNKQVLIDIPNNSVYQPEWLDHENIFIVSEHETHNQFWNLYLFNIKNQSFTPVITGQFELGLPLWQLGTNTFVYNVKGNEVDIYCYKMSHGQSVIATCKISNAEVVVKDIINIPIVYIQDTLCLSNGNLYFLASTSVSELSVYEYKITDKHLKAINSSALLEMRDASIAQEIKFTNKFGMESYGFFYEPPTGSAMHGSVPPLIIICHGGPTGTTNCGYNTKIQYWTSRGFAVLDVNYSGSTTYGKKYRDRINFEWGVVDVADCAAAAQYLIENNKVDAKNIIIRGSSAGGLIVLLALLQYDIFSAGCCYYPVSDLILLSEQIHNFEKYYNERLIGNLQDHHKQYTERSPINFAEKLNKPILIFHGTEDKVIPISHTRTLFKKINSNNKLSNYYEFAGEGHGFRNMETIKSTLDHEYSFYLETIKK